MGYNLVNDSSSRLSQLKVVNWGRTDYTEALERQLKLVEQRKAGTVSDHLIFTEHPPTFTIGKRSNAKKNLIWDLSRCAQEGISVIQTNRGGDITYHGPGQLVCYAILSLKAQPDLHKYLRGLESVVIQSLERMGIQTGRREGKTGIWVGSRKICAIGVAVRSWISYHGFAINIDPNLEHFSGIVPCGITDGSVTSIAQECPEPIQLDELKTTLAVEFERMFMLRSSHE